MTTTFPDPTSSAQRKPLPPQTKKTLLIVLCVLYVLSPIDLLPDLIPVLGWVDDIGAIVAAIGMIKSLMRGDARTGGTEERP